MFGMQASNENSITTKQIRKF